MEEDPFAIVEAMTIDGFATGSERGFLYLRARVPALRRRGWPTRSRPRAVPATCGDDILGAGLRVRHRDPPRRRRLRLRRGDGPVQLDRGQARRAAQQAAVPGRGRPVRQAHGRQQHRDAGQHPPDRRRRRRGLCRDRHRGQRRAQAASASPARSSVRRLRARLRGDARRPAGAGRRRGRGASAQGGAPRRRRGGFVGPEASTCRSRSRAPGRPARRSDPEWSLVYDEHRRPASTRSSGSQPSSATNRAASACRAGSAPSGRRSSLARLAAGRPRGPLAGELAAAGRPWTRHARRQHLRPGQTASAAIESALRAGLRDFAVGGAAGAAGTAPGAGA